MPNELEFRQYIDNAIAVNCRSYKRLELQGSYREFDFAAEDANEIIALYLAREKFLEISSEASGSLICAGKMVDCQNSLSYYVDTHPNEDINMIVSDSCISYECIN